MEVILLERIEKLGQMGDVVKVKDGHARNFLLPRKKALRATEQNRIWFEQQRTQLEAKNLDHKQDADGVAAKLEGQNYVIIRQASESGQLYGSVTIRDIAADITQSGITVGRSQIVLDIPIKTLGLYDVRIVLHPEVSVNVTVNVARTAEEAKRQARGEDVLGEQEEEEAIAAEEVFEDKDRARQAEEELQRDAEQAEGVEQPQTETTEDEDEGDDGAEGGDGGDDGAKSGEASDDEGEKDES